MQPLEDIAILYVRNTKINYFLIYLNFIYLFALSLSHFRLGGGGGNYLINLNLEHNNIFTLFTNPNKSKHENTKQETFECNTNNFF